VAVALAVEVAVTNGDKVVADEIGVLDAVTVGDGDLVARSPTPATTTSATTPSTGQYLDDFMH
jgi:hypothetical protein